MELKDMLEIVAAGLAVVMAVFGLAIMFRQIAKVGLGPYNLQGLGLVLLVPTILMLAPTDDAAGRGCRLYFWPWRRTLQMSGSGLGKLALQG